MKRFSADRGVDHWRELCHTHLTITTDTPITIPEELTAPAQLFLRSLSGRNLGQHTITAYETDLRQFPGYLADSKMALARIAQVERQDISVLRVGEGAARHLYLGRQR